MRPAKVTIPVEKAVLAKARKLDAEAHRKICEAREKEDQQWRDAEGTKSRAAKRREEKAEKRAEASARKAEARLLAKQEEKDLGRNLNVKKMNKKVTAAELLPQREAAIQKTVKEEKRKQRRVVTKHEYERMIAVENKNRDDSVIEAHSIEEAIAVVTRKENLSVLKVEAKQGNKGNCLFVYTADEEKPLLVDVRLI